jgi:hypothetical protein
MPCGGEDKDSEMVLEFPFEEAIADENGLPN